MIVIALICLVSIILGLYLGKKLADRGITAENALVNHQRLTYIILIFLATVIITFLLSAKANLKFFPQIILLYIGEYTNDFVLGLGWFSVGFLLGLELPIHGDRQRLQKLILAVIIITIPLAGLIHYSLPVTNLLGEPVVVEEVVLQTTSYTCAPASIATIARITGTFPNFSEKDAIILTGTNRFGTSTLAEMRALRSLGFAPHFRDSLKTTDLINLNLPALLHVNEPVNGGYIQHAVVLLQVDATAQIVTIGNPLYGQQLKTFDQMQEYWTGEVVVLGQRVFGVNLKMMFSN
ncbi:cysteine peptidase family C39 domain-containing protein [Okeania sp. SIO1F9]|uniref:cysteine peptidase family C39 domain-containing protein n=1 Tax=Okeania sp. SIO1F9 TaxID=2607813 RepID=UPI00144CE7DF|nr:cysteine peptidase family C39 domain-containing protein [Okeania sp. SIO1F9]NET76141.1 peptidase C39 bacteriocin processing [Okeania sp. SIO1F9]